MFFKIAFRNVKRQIKNYLIYFLTVVLTVAILFAFNSVIFSESITKFASSMSDFKAAMIAVVILISLVVAFVLKYATSFMLKLRKREFGTYLTLGMNRKNILLIFIFETTLICLVALGLGLILGAFIYQGLMALIMNLLEMKFKVTMYSFQGLTFTLAIVIGIFVISSIASAFYLKRVSIYDLIHGDKKVEKKVHYPILWFIIAIISLAAIIASCFICKSEIDKMLLNGATPGKFIYSLLVFAVAIILFYIGLARSITHVLLNRKRARTGTNTFVLRQLSSTMRSNSIMFGLLAFLITFAVIAANTSFVMKATQDKMTEHDYPFDILYVDNVSNESNNKINLLEAEKIIGKHVKVENKTPYTIYTSDRNDFYSHTRWSGEGYGGLTDSFMSLSDFNAISVPLGYTPLELKDEYFIVSNIMHLKQINWEDVKFGWNNEIYKFNNIDTDYPQFCFMYFFVIVPDQAIDEMRKEVNYMAYDIKDEKYNATVLRDELSYISHTNGIDFIRTDFLIKEYHRIADNSISAFFIVAALFISTIFLFMTMAILSLKTLSTMSEDRKRYSVLFRLGVGVKEQNKTLFRQTFVFFITPLIIPLLSNIPIAIICHHLIKLQGNISLASQVSIIAVMISLTMSLIYALYYIATYLIAKKSIVHSDIIYR